MKPITPTTTARVAAFAILLSSAGMAREWTFTGIPKPMEAEFVAMKNGGVVLQGPNGKSFEVPLTSFSPADQKFLRLLEAGGGKAPAEETPGKPVTSRTGYKSSSSETLTNQVVSLGGPMEVHVTGTGDPITGSSFNFTSPDGWLFLDNIAPSVVASKYLDRMLVNGRKAALKTNIRVVQHGDGAVVIPHEPDFPAMTVYEGKDQTGASMPLKCHVEYNDARLLKMEKSISSFVLKRGYTATIAANENGTGTSVNYVAQDHDLEVKMLPKDLDDGVRFVRIFPWRWVSKKGVAGAIWQKLDVGWFYDWNIGTESSLDLEYVPMPDGVELLADLYVPRRVQHAPTILMRCPYGRRGAFGSGAKLAQQAGEAMLGEEGGERLGRDRIELEIVERDRQRAVFLELDQHPAEPRHVGLLDQAVAELARLHRGRCGERAFERAVFLDQLGRGLGPNAADAGHVVHCIAHQRQHIANALRLDPELLHHFGQVDPLVLHRIEHVDVAAPGIWPADQLHQILVGRDDDHLAAGVAHLAHGLIDLVHGGQQTFFTAHGATQQIALAHDLNFKLLSAHFVLIDCLFSAHESESEEEF